MGVPKPDDADFHSSYRDLRLYRDWTKALDDYRLEWEDLTSPKSPFPRLWLTRQNLELVLLGAHQGLKRKSIEDKISFPASGEVLIGDHEGRVTLIQGDVQTEAQLHWCQSCESLFFISTWIWTCPSCKGASHWLVEKTKLSWFGFAGEVNFHPLDLRQFESWTDRETDRAHEVAKLAAETSKAPVPPPIESNDLFDEAEAQSAQDREEGKWEVLKKSLSGRARVHGWPAMGAIDDLEEQYPNFKEVCDFVRCEIGLGPYRIEPQMRLPNILIVGGPGCGKSSFCERLGEIIAVGDVERIDFAQNPASFELTGADSGYNRSKEGRVVRALASTGSSPVRNPVLVLEEIDKVDAEMRYTPLPSLLSLLEKEQAQKFRDAFLGFHVDASGIQFLATANDRYKISGPLLSRFELFTVADYSQREFTEKVVEGIYRRWKSQYHEGTFPESLASETRQLIAEEAAYVPRRVGAILIRLANQGVLDLAPRPTFEHLMRGTATRKDKRDLW